MALNEYIDETIDDLDLASFNVHDQLCPKLWDGMDLKENIRRKLLDIAQQFYDSLDLSKGVLSDIIFLGSLANYNWSQYSDIDIHLVMDFTNIDAGPELLRAYFNLKKDDWKSKHDIHILGFDVEFYVEDIKDKNAAESRYSLITGSWILKPEKANVRINKVKIQLKAEAFIDAIREVKALSKIGEPERAWEYASKLYEKVYDYRKAGLESGGEFSVENIVFKALRRSGAIDELRELKNELFDKIYSLEES